LDWNAIGNHLPGVDVFSTPGKYFLYLSVVSGSVGCGDSVADQRKNQALNGFTEVPPKMRVARATRIFFMHDSVSAGNFTSPTVD
jgi:hypothetical protein